MFYSCNTGVNYMCNTPKTPQVYCIYQIQIQIQKCFRISCKVFTISNSTINQILSIWTYYTQIVNKVTNYIMLGVFIWDGCMLFNHAHHDVHTQQVQYIQDQCTIYNKKCFILVDCYYLFYIWQLIYKLYQ